MYKYQSKCKFRMLTNVGDQILEIRPKQVIESDMLINNDYLVLIEDKPKAAPKKKGRPRLGKNEEYPKRTPSDS